MMDIIYNAMGHSREEKQRNHDRIVEIAAARIREAGVDGPGVAEIMSAAGLTHGGFYKHFGSRDDLVAEAVERALAESAAATAEVIEEADDPLAAFVDWYASRAHCDDPATGCPVVALGGDVPRADARVRGAYGEQVEHYVALLERLLGDRERAVAAVSTLVGGVLLARAVDDDALSDEILAAVRAAVKG